MYSSLPISAFGTGAVYTFGFRETSWSLLGSINGNTSSAEFGYSVSATTGWLAIGSPGAICDGYAVGSVYVYKSDTTSPAGYALVNVLTPSLANTNGQFGGSVDVSNSWLIAGDATNG
jgi:hypothetical protein